MEFWTTKGLSTVVSGVGKPLYPDAITRACTRLDFARVCVMIDVKQKLHKHIIVMAPNEDGGETPCKVDVEYEWLPPKCTTCMQLGHMTNECPMKKSHKPTKPPVNVYVPKVSIPPPQPPPKEQKTMKPVVVEKPKTDGGDMHVDRNNSKQEERGKALVLYNTFDALHLIDDADEHSGGPNTSNPICNDPYHQLALKDLVSEYRLHFLGILETPFLLPQWKWFVDYSSVGNRIWLAWDENIVDVHILDLGDQFIHCRITNKATNEHVIITVIYGASKVIDRRNLWSALGTLAQQCSEVPWMVGGDFNAVRDLNEVCGISGDIRMATEEFNTGILEAGLLPLPMQGEWFTWHNCSTSTRSLWKRLDRILTNDRWLARFPTLAYHSLTPRTSDHSPLVIHGDTQRQNGGMFQFDNYLTHSPDFIPSVQNIWQHEVVGLPMYAVSRKLKALKPVFRQQRRNKGDLTLNFQLAKGFLEEAQNLVSSDRQNELFLFLEHCCRLVYAKAAKLEQIMLQQRAKLQWMKGGDQCSRIFFRKIAQRRAVRRILQINDENGTTHTEPSEVVHEFMSFYQNLLGGNRRRLLVDINYLRPWARHIFSNEEASHLFLPFSPEDVKQAIFDIAEDKAPGPDGFSSGFFKAAWAVVGTEVTRAVLDFFTTGKLLKQVNTTLLALIPKVHTPMSVNDFRPISCCNVLYKVITKLLVQRLSMVLDKLISPCQTAFIPGRSIGDNIMLAQELFTGYNQIRLPPRCALKVDIRKAYDTVEWDFLVAVLQFFNFPTILIRWIEECITTASFSIGLNGKPHGFFNGARGLRQGDPLSPYLFVLVMEDMQFTYHWKCEPARVFQLGFADDLLLFCRADMDSVSVFKMGLDRFAEWSGLRLNVQKSHLFISRSAQDRKDQMLAVLGFQEGHLPMRYLGLPLLSSRLSISDCQPLLSKIDAHITGWEGISLSYAGRVQIIKSVLSTLSLYWASAFILPKAVIKEVEKRLRTFLWKGTSMTGYAKLAWKDVCKPVEEGGLGIKDIGILNRALMTKKLCDIIRCDRTSIWVEWLQHGRLRNNSIWTVGEQGGSWGWRKLLHLRSYIQPMVELHIGDGRTFYLWKDPWHQLGPLLPRFPRGPNLLGLEDSTKLSSVIDGGQWHWPLIMDMECLQITYTLPQIHGGDDMIIRRFPDGQPTTQALFFWLATTLKTSQISLPPNMVNTRSKQASVEYIDDVLPTPSSCTPFNITDPIPIRPLESYNAPNTTEASSTESAVEKQVVM
ncbi:UNVERIFIED_CONTAM: Retrovirus-related Pol polyprotein from type-1 retrotransposable element R2 [Sesamum indicum]